MSNEKRESIEVKACRLFKTERIEIGPTDSFETLKGSDIFGDRVYGVDLSSISWKSAPATDVIIFRKVSNGNFSNLFGHLSEKRPRWQNPGQVLAFYRDHKDKLLGGHNFFELEWGVVVEVRFNDEDHDGGLPAATVHHFHVGRVWFAESELRTISPQQ